MTQTPKAQQEKSTQTLVRRQGYQQARTPGKRKPNHPLAARRTLKPTTDSHQMRPALIDDCAAHASNSSVISASPAGTKIKSTTLPVRRCIRRNPSHANQPASRQPAHRNKPTSTSKPCPRVPVECCLQVLQSSPKNQKLRALPALLSPFCS
ncbi:hypothetical protein N658DRAFT_75558 [Parathielavia hyrcaniae]|uniref:Uncharacterized protein n=1 Tax=Parathielavia hyrcaniae TaxID=113614 RepID=A0AAN6Q2B7_9PEZI|nr:hypothetical protein N658DRAFT_75558 [Parathielavia hyrcaniae]